LSLPRPALEEGDLIAFLYFTEPIQTAFVNARIYDWPVPKQLGVCLIHYALLPIRLVIKLKENRRKFRKNC
jgi:hypothetical protein